MLLHETLFSSEWAIRAQALWKQFEAFCAQGLGAGLVALRLWISGSHPMSFSGHCIFSSNMIIRNMGNIICNMYIYIYIYT